MKWPWKPVIERSRALVEGVLFMNTTASPGTGPGPAPKRIFAELHQSGTPARAHQLRSSPGRGAHKRRAVIESEMLGVMIIARSHGSRSRIGIGYDAVVTVPPSAAGRRAMNGSSPSRAAWPRTLTLAARSS